MDDRRPRLPSVRRPASSAPDSRPEAAPAEHGPTTAADAEDAAAGASRPAAEPSPEELRSRIHVVETAGPDAGGVTEAQAPAGEPGGWKVERASRWSGRIRRFWRFTEGGSAHTNFWLVLGSTLALTAIGLTMVLSSSSVDAFGNSGSSFTLFIRQAMWAGVGLIGMFLISRLPDRALGLFGWVLMIFSGLLLALVVFTPLGHEVNGSKNWLRLGPVQGQPSELAKLALVLWGAAVLTRKGRLVRQFVHWVMPLVLPGALSILVLVLLGGDLGTSLIILLMVGTLLFTVGVSWRYFAVTAVSAVVAVLLLAWTSSNRLFRIQAWLGMNCDHASDPCHQSQQGIYALATGGFWGVGLGQSRQKWHYIPEVENDFILTILGEELGLLGTLVVLLLFGALILGIFRVATNTTDRFARLACMGIAAWLVGQAFINIGMVTGLLPVIGVPLPFISYGGSALTCALLAVGVVLNFAHRRRREDRDRGHAGPEETRTGESRTSSRVARSRVPEPSPERSRRPAGQNRKKAVSP
ncbi:putative lipid II flippase FtsW [Nesterenkonia xinjiangensis]|uniref:Probable peptidoglycan glycosyltransferase FtsW n=1 Tax=Nesterenkonia xinjiangensis TaxID=225327 RepID=A0A7Z0GPE0_9MICC|nr:putative lipid II flippase FtsW [Nesterenkonia xinjiangensis]NYJ79254.1 cell division protein FtsW [Nesterenkonia xinjiangensis]